MITQKDINSIFSTTNTYAGAHFGYIIVTFTILHSMLMVMPRLFHWQ